MIVLPVELEADRERIGVEKTGLVVKLQFSVGTAETAPPSNRTGIERSGAGGPFRDDFPLVIGKALKPNMKWRASRLRRQRDVADRAVARIDAL